MISTPSITNYGSTTQADNATSFQSNHEVVSSIAPVFIVIAVVAILGNLLVVFLFVRNRSWLKKAHSNLILAMAITDILTAVCILAVPLFVHDTDVYPVPKSPVARALYCRVIWSHYVVFALGVTSVYTCLSLAIERWLAIGKPLFYKQHLHSKRNIALMALLPWLAGFAFETSALIRTTGVVYPDGTTDCRWNPDTSERPGRVAIAVVTFLGMIMIPGLLVVVTYVHILIKVKRTITRNSQVKRDTRDHRENTGDQRNSRDKKNSRKDERNSQNQRNKTDFRRITVMAGMASMALVTCWLPGQLYFMLGQLDYVELHNAPHRWLNVLAFSSTCLNPFIYAFWNPNYREGFKAQLAWLVCWKRNLSFSSKSQSKDNSCGMIARRSDQSTPPTDV